MCIGLAAGALLSSPRRSVSTLRASVGQVTTQIEALVRMFDELRGKSVTLAEASQDHGRQIQWLQDARAKTDQDRREQVALLLGRLDGLELRLKSAEQAHASLAADMLQLGSEINSRLDVLEALERRVSELASKDALVATIDRQLQDMQAFIVEAAERAKQSAPPVAPVVSAAPVPPLPMRPGLSAQGPTSAASLDNMLQMQRQAQQAFLARQQAGQDLAGIQGAGL